MGGYTIVSTRGEEDVERHGESDNENGGDEMKQEMTAPDPGRRTQGEC